MKQSRRQVPSIPIMETPIPFSKATRWLLRRWGVDMLGAWAGRANYPPSPKKTIKPGSGAIVGGNHFLQLSAALQEIVTT